MSDRYQPIPPDRRTSQTYGVSGSVQSLPTEGRLRFMSQSQEIMDDQSWRERTSDLAKRRPTAFPRPKTQPLEDTDFDRRGSLQQQMQPQQDIDYDRRALDRPQPQQQWRMDEYIDSPDGYEDNEEIVYYQQQSPCSPCVPYNPCAPCDPCVPRGLCIPCDPCAPRGLCVPCDPRNPCGNSQGQAFALAPNRPLHYFTGNTPANDSRGAVPRRVLELSDEDRISGYTYGPPVQQEYTVNMLPPAPTRPSPPRTYPTRLPCPPVPSCFPRPPCPPPCPPCPPSRGGNMVSRPPCLPCSSSCDPCSPAMLPRCEPMAPSSFVGPPLISLPGLPPANSPMAASNKIRSPSMAPGSTRQRSPSMAPNSMRQRSPSNASDSTRQRSPSMAPDSMRQRLPSMATDTMRQRSPSMATDSMRQRSPSMATDSMRQRLPSMAADSMRQRSPSMATDSMRQRTPSMAVDPSRQRSGSMTTDPTRQRSYSMAGDPNRQRSPSLADDPTRQRSASSARDRALSVVPSGGMQVEEELPEEPDTEEDEQSDMLQPVENLVKMEPLRPPPAGLPPYRVTRKGLVKKDTYVYGNFIDIDQGINVQGVPYVYDIFYHDDQHVNGETYVNIYGNVLLEEIGPHFCAFLNSEGGIILLGAAEGENGRLVVQGCGAPECRGPDVIQKGVDGLFVDHIRPHVFPHQYQMRVHKVEGGGVSHLWLTEIIIKSSRRPDVVYKLTTSDVIFTRKFNHTEETTVGELASIWHKRFNEKFRAERDFVHNQKKETENHFNFLKEEINKLDLREQKMICQKTEKMKTLDEEQKRINTAIEKIRSQTKAQKKENSNIKTDPQRGLSESINKTLLDEANQEIETFKEFYKDVIQKGNLDSFKALGALEKYYKLTQSKIENLKTEKEVKRCL